MERMVTCRVVGIGPPDDDARTDSPARSDGNRSGPTMGIPSPANSSPARVVLLGAALATSLIAGCTVGPDFTRPAAPDVGDYTSRPLSTTASTTGVAGGDAQRFVRGSDIPGDWWTLFHSKPLDALIEQSLANNPDLKAAQAALSAARENVLAQRGAYYPNVSAGFSATRQSTSGALAPTPSTNAVLYNLFTPQVSVSYVPDVFGLNRRTVESMQAQEQSARFQMVAAHITLSTNVATTAIQEASLLAQVDATRQLIDINTSIVKVLQYQFDKGYASRLDLAAQESLLAQATAALPALLQQLDQQRHLLATLTGQFPGQAAAVDFDLASLQLPTDVPVSLPSALVAQRPDVLQAEANLHAASAQIGIAIANRLPNFELTGNAGSSALAIGQLFTAGSGFWALGAAVTAPIFQGGTLLHQERAAKAAYDQSAAQYRSTVLTAFQNVADTLTALEHDAEGLKAAANAASAARVTLDLTQRQYQAGYASYLTFLSAQQTAQQARIALVQAQASRYVDTAALFQALGGGWWRRADLQQTDPKQADPKQDRHEK